MNFLDKGKDRDNNDNKNNQKKTKMTKRDFFILLIKVYGLYLIISILFSVIPSNIAFVISDIELSGIIWLIGTVLVLIGLFVALLIYAEKVSKLLKLEKGFDDDRIDFSGLKSIDIIKFAVLIIGGFLFIKNIPAFLSHTLFAFKSTQPTSFDQAYNNQALLKYNSLKDYINWASSGFNILIGFLLVSNFKKVSVYLNRKITE